MWKNLSEYGLNAIELKAALENNLPGNFAFNVYANNELPDGYQSRPIAIIINTDDNDRSGRHWQSLYIANDTDCTPEFFCSFGQEMSPQVAQFLKDQNFDFALHFHDVLQDPMSATCGLFALDFLLFRSHSLGKLTDYALRFSPSDFARNELELSRYFVNKDTKRLEYINTLSI